MRIAILGVGLIGGSIGRAARARIDGATVVGFDPDPETVARAVGVGAVTARRPRSPRPARAPR